MTETDLKIQNLTAEVDALRKRVASYESTGLEPEEIRELALKVTTWRKRFEWSTEAAMGEEKI